MGREAPLLGEAIADLEAEGEPIAGEQAARVPRRLHEAIARLRIGKGGAVYAACLARIGGAEIGDTLEHFAVEICVVGEDRPEIGRAHVRTPVTNAHIVSSHLLEKKKNTSE